MLLLAAVAVSSRFGGKASGMLATLLSAAAIDCWLLPPFVRGFHAVLPLSSFIVVALLLTPFSRVKSEAARREEADAGLRASEQRFRSAFAHSASGMALTDKRDRSAVARDVRMLEHYGVVQISEKPLPVMAGRKWVRPMAREIELTAHL